jgi:uncharacterized protein
MQTPALTATAATGQIAAAAAAATTLPASIAYPASHGRDHARGRDMGFDRLLESLARMIRPLIRRVAARLEALRDRWYVQPFSRWLLDSRLWSLRRRGITSAFAAGLAICFVPLPVHVPLALAVAILARINVAVLLATVMLVNPLTVLPVYYLSYVVGARLLRFELQPFQFALSWDWLQHGLGPVWKPFLVGCVVCAAAAALLGWFCAELLWRRWVIKKYRARRAASSA